MSIGINTNLLVRAVQYEDTAEVRRLIPISDPKKNDSFPLLLAAESGYVEGVKLLIPVSDPKADNSWALQGAAKYGHAKCVQLLIPVSDPTANYSTALRWAAEYGHTHCMELLYPVSDPIAALNDLKDEFPDIPDKWMRLEQMIEVERVKRVLNAEIGDPNDQINGFKIQRKM